MCIAWLPLAGARGDLSWLGVGQGRLPDPQPSRIAAADHAKCQGSRAEAQGDTLALGSPPRGLRARLAATGRGETLCQSP
jgi:hypothetical protein